MIKNGKDSSWLLVKKHFLEVLDEPLKPIKADIKIIKESLTNHITDTNKKISALDKKVGAFDKKFDNKIDALSGKMDQLLEKSQ